MKDKLWLIGVLLIIIGLGVGLKVNQTIGMLLTVVGMLISILCILMNKDK